MRIAASILLLTRRYGRLRAPALDWKAIDWKNQEAEILRHYRGHLGPDRLQQPARGAETQVVNYIKKVFDAEGIPSQVFALDPARAEPGGAH